MKTYLIALLVLVLWGCDIPNKGIVETSVPPVILQTTETPNTIDVNHLANLPDDLIDTSITLTASIGYLNSGTHVFFALLDPNGNTLENGPFEDNGLYPDITAGDGILSASLPLHIRKMDVGSYQIQIQATDAQGFASNTVIQSLTVRNSNNHPPVLSNLQMPDTVQVPPLGDTTFVKITVTASDSDGLGDIVSVKLTSAKPNGSSAGQFNLYDDGGRILYTQFGAPLSSGDSLAGDGIFTISIPLTVPGEPPPTFRDFSFQATDRTGDRSNVISKRITIVP